jgi:hypothetical protein
VLGLPCIQLFEVVIDAVADKVFYQSYCTINDSRYVKMISETAAKCIIIEPEKRVQV